MTMSNERENGKLKNINGNKTFVEAHQIELMTVLMNLFSMIALMNVLLLILYYFWT